MKQVIAAAILVAGLLVPQFATASVGGMSSGGLRQASPVETVQYGGYCERLRRACEFKFERGEAGEGNCRRYRDECGRVSYCERLRRACVYKDDRGESGMGNCRRYRSECGSRW